MTSHEIFALRKQGQIDQALEMARDNYLDNADDIWFLRAYAWALYDKIKEIITKWEKKHLSAFDLSDQLTPLMREFAKNTGLLRDEKDLAFSSICRIAYKASKDWPQFLAFSCWTGIDNFSDEDRKPFVSEKGKSIESFEKRFIHAICREAVDQRDNPQLSEKSKKWGLDVLGKSLKKYPDDQWLNYYQSKLHLAAGETDLAIQCLMPVLRRQSRAAWPWARLGDIFATMQTKDALTCYAHATQLSREEQEVAKVRILLAQHLANVERFYEAAQQTFLAVQYREKNGYKIPNDLQQLLDSSWYQQALAQKKLQSLPDMQSEARALLRALDKRNLKYTTGIIEHVNEKKALSYVITTGLAGFPLYHKQFPDVKNLPAGSFLEIGHVEGENRALDWKHSKAQELPGVCEKFSGTLERREGQDFAFARTTRGDVFVPPHLATSFMAGSPQQVTLLAIKQNDDKFSSWKAIKLLGQGISQDAS